MLNSETAFAGAADRAEAGAPLPPLPLGGARFAAAAGIVNAGSDRTLVEQIVAHYAARIDELDANGGAEVYHQFQTRGLGGFTTVNVVDSTGEVVLTGTIDQSS